MEHRNAEQTKEQMEKTNTRVKHLKRQLDESEEECARLTAQKRKTQRDLDEQMEHNEVIHRELEQMKARLRIGGSATDKLSKQKSKDRTSARMAVPGVFPPGAVQSFVSNDGSFDETPNDNDQQKE